MNLPKTANVVVIGGGVMGASIVYHLAKRGTKDIVLIEQYNFFGQGATGKCAGGVRYQFGTRVNIQLSLASLPMFEAFKAEIGYPIDYRQCGYLFLLTDERDVKQFQNHVALQHKLGVETEWLDGEDIRIRLPFMHIEDVLAGTYCSKEGLVDPNGVVMGYIQAANRLGAKTFTDTEVTGISINKDNTLEIHTSQGELSTPCVVNAAGPWANLIGAMVHLDIPIQPVRRQILVTTPIPNFPADFPFVIDFAQSLYFHREGEGLLTGMSNPDQKPGLNQNVDPEWELTSLEAAIKRIPFLSDAGLASHWAGLYEITPDAHPIFGGTSVEGFYICSGFSGHGFMHGPISGKIMSEIILDKRSMSVDVSMLDLDRFQENRPIKEFYVI